MTRDAVQARAAGKEAVRASTIWTLELATGFALRCLKTANGCELQARVKGKWELVEVEETNKRTPANLLRVVSTSTGLARGIEIAAALATAAVERSPG